MKLSRIAPLLLALLTAPAFSAEPLWIWHTKEAADGEVRFFRKEVTLEAAPAKATLRASCDNEETIFVNGKEVGASAEWAAPVVADVKAALHPGANVIAVRGKNQTGSAALVLRLDLENADGSKSSVVTDETLAELGKGERPVAAGRQHGSRVAKAGCDREDWATNRGATFSRPRAKANGSQIRQIGRGHAGGGTCYAAGLSGRAHHECRQRAARLLVRHDDRRQGPSDPRLAVRQQDHPRDAERR